MAQSPDTYLSSLYSDVIQLFEGNKGTKPAVKDFSYTGGYQAPIKSMFYNSGNFSPNKATDARHPQGHQGVDLRSAGGTPVYPIALGLVTFVGPNPAGGNVVNVQHANGVRSYYAHLGTITVHEGDKVNNNTVIGTVGNSGNAKNTWPHVHLQVWKDNQIQNPGNYFSVPQYSNVNQEKEKFWLSSKDKQIAQSFDVSKHNAQRPIAASKYDELVKLATYYEELAQIK